jgi:alpha-methylacyl-CoA racemase
MRAAVAARLAQRTRDEWAATFEATDACVAPVLSLEEAPRHPHARARQAHAMVGPMTRPRPAPRYSRSATRLSGPPARAVEDALAAFGIAPEEIDALASAGILGR